MIITETISLKTNGDCDVVNITHHVQAQLAKSNLKSGIVTVFVTGSTAGVTTIEYEPGLIADLPELLEKLVPSGVSYQHDRTWHDGNGHAHLRSALIGPDITIPFVAGKLMLGTWQQVIFLDFDNRRRDRELIVQIMGE